MLMIKGVLSTILVGFFLNVQAMEEEMSFDDETTVKVIRLVQEEAQQQFNWSGNDLPLEILVKIMDNLRPQELVIASLVCTQWNDVSTQIMADNLAKKNIAIIPPKDEIASKYLGLFHYLKLEEAAITKNFLLAMDKAVAAGEKYRFRFQHGLWFIDVHDFHYMYGSRENAKGTSFTKHATRIHMVSPTFTFNHFEYVNADVRGAERIRFFYTPNPEGFGAGGEFILKIVKTLK